MIWRKRSNSRYSGWKPYVPVADRRAEAAKHLEKENKKGNTCNPILIEGRTISKTFWGQSWCTHLESFSDYSNRLPRGRTYARNGSIVDFQVEKGIIKAKVMGSSLYRVEIKIEPIPESKWKLLTEACTGKIDSLIELLQGKFSKSVMEILTEKVTGLFPNPKEIHMSCSCPDWATMCKHAAAVLYGMGASLDTHPEWLFALRHVDHLDLISSAEADSTLLQAPAGMELPEDLSALFGIELDTSNEVVLVEEAPKKRGRKKKES